MAVRVEATFLVASAPEAYSFWASIIRRVLLVGVAVLGGRPIRSRKEGGADMLGGCRGFDGVVGGLGVGRLMGVVCAEVDRGW